MESSVSKDHTNGTTKAPVIDSKTHIEHHKKAAAHHEEAAKHHHEAAKHVEAGNPEKAAISTAKANGHGVIANEHHNSIAKAHVASK